MRERKTPPGLLLLLRNLNQSPLMQIPYDFLHIHVRNYLKFLNSNQRSYRRFDLVFETDSSQSAVYDGCVSSLLDGCMLLISNGHWDILRSVCHEMSQQFREFQPRQGYNATVFAYGQTGPVAVETGSFLQLHHPKNLLVIWCGLHMKRRPTSYRASRKILAFRALVNLALRTPEEDSEIATNSVHAGSYDF